MYYYKVYTLNHTREQIFFFFFAYEASRGCQEQIKSVHIQYVLLELLDQCPGWKHHAEGAV